MNRFKKIKNWLLTCPNLDSYIYFNVTPEDMGSTALTTDANVSGIIQTFNNGAKRVELYFNVSVVRDYDSGTSDVNIDSMGFFENLTEWIETQNRLKNFPDFGSDLVESVEPAYTNADIYIHEDETKCQYVAKYKITFVKI